MCASTVTLLLKPKVRDSQLGRCPRPLQGAPLWELQHRAQGPRPLCLGPGAPPLLGFPSGRAAGSRLGSGTPLPPQPSSWIPHGPCTCTLPLTTQQHSCTVPGFDLISSPLPFACLLSPLSTNLMSSSIHTCHCHSCIWKSIPLRAT